jgi:hypothetical protein
MKIGEERSTHAFVLHTTHTRRRTTTPAGLMQIAKVRIHTHYTYTN